MGYHVKHREVSCGAASLVIPSGDSTTRPNTPIFGQIRFNTDLNALEVFAGGVFTKLSLSGDFSYVVDEFIGDGSTTNFTMCRNCVDPMQLIVFVGSIYQAPITNYVTNDSYEIMFPSAPYTGAIINVVHSGT